MDEEDEFGAEVFTHFVFNVKFTRVIENIIVPANVRFKMEFIPLDSSSSEDIDKAFTKMKWWIDNIFAKSIAFCHDNTAALNMFIDEANGACKVGNVLVLTPEEPDDQHLAAIMQAKLQALCNDTMAFGPVEVRSDNQLGLQFSFVGDSKTVLPSMAEWVGERSYFDRPWWDRDDGSTLDVMPTPDADLNEKPSWAFNFDFLDKPKINPSATSRIVRPEFRPTVIDGGKSKGE